MRPLVHVFRFTVFESRIGHPQLQTPLRIKILFEDSETPLANRLSHLGHKGHEVVDIVDGIQTVGEELFGHKEMTQVGP